MISNQMWISICDRSVHEHLPDWRLLCMNGQLSYNKSIILWINNNHRVLESSSTADDDDAEERLSSSDDGRWSA